MTRRAGVWLVPLLCLACESFKVLPAKDAVAAKEATPPPLGDRTGVTVLSHEPVPLDEGLVPDLMPPGANDRGVVGGRTVSQAERRAARGAAPRPDVAAVPRADDLAEVALPDAPGPEAGAAERGAYLYALHCSTCHGAGGQGDGPSAEALLYPPADLTRVAERRGGVFVPGDVAAHLDGRVAHPSHGVDEPLWGPGLVADPARIDALLGHLESLQVGVASEPEPEI